MIKDIEINKTPYLYSSPNLFNQFFLVGYTEEEKQKELRSQIDSILYLHESNGQEPKTEAVNSLLSIQNKLVPSILSSIALNEKITIPDSFTLLSLTFPTPPKIYLAFSQNVSDPSIDYSVVFFLNFDLNDSNGKKVLCYGFCNIIYEPVKYSTAEVYYVPKGYLFISNYPYFSHFYQLSKEISKAMTNTQMPIEIILYNIINYTPRTIAGEMSISWFPDSFHAKRYLFEPLSGYPILDFNCVEMFAILPLHLIIKVVILGQLEFDMLFFSKNIEMLNLFMYIFSALHYPLTDTMYLWHIFSISEEELLNEDYSSNFVGKPNSSMLGVNCEYNETINTDAFSNSFFIVDLDRQKIMFKSNDTENKSNETLRHFFEYISSVIQNREKPQSNFEHNLLKLIKEIENISNKIILNNSRGTTFIPNFYEVDDSSLKKNRLIQDIFYSFTLNLLKPIHRRCLLKKNALTLYSINKDYKENYIEEEKEKEAKANREEDMFYELFHNCVKFNTFVVNFLSLHDCYDCYRIPFLFFEEFLQMNNSIDEEYAFKHFDIIDSFFNRNNSIKMTEINVCKYASLVKKKLKHSLEFVNGQSIQSIQSKSKTHNTKSTKDELDQSIICNYSSIINNLDDVARSNCFPSKDAIIPLCSYSSLTSLIEAKLRKSKLLTPEEMLSHTIIIFSAIIYPLLSPEEFTLLFKSVFELLKGFSNSFLRKYIYLILSLYYNQALMLKEQKMDYQNILIAFHVLIELAYVKNIHPNIQLSELIKRLSQIDKEAIDYQEYFVNEELFTTEDIDLTRDTDLMDRMSKFYRSSTVSPSASLNIIETDKSPEKSTRSRDKLDITPPSLSLSQTYPSCNGFILILTYNGCKDGVKKEDFIIQKAFEYNLDTDIRFKCNKCQTDLKPKLMLQKKVDNKKSGFMSEILFPAKAFALSSQSLLPNWIASEQKAANLDKELLKKLMLNILFYQLKLKLKNKVPLINGLFD